MVKPEIVILLVALAGAAALLAEAREESPTKKPRAVRRLYKTPPVDEKLAAENLKASARFGLPSTDNLRLFNHFLFSYDRRLKGPAWVLEHLTRDNFQSKANRLLSKFKPDETLHELFRSRDEDFVRPDRALPGYDRGHLAPSGDFAFDQDATDQSFCLSNVMPQTAQLNRGAWVRLEKYVAHLARHKTTKNVYVITGPLFLPERDPQTNELFVRYKVMGPDRISVPPAFFKVFLRETLDEQLILDAFVMPNTHDDYLRKLPSIDEFRWPMEQLDVIERAVGAIFFDKLDRSKLTQPREGFELGYIDEPIIWGKKKDSASAEA